MNNFAKQIRERFPKGLTGIFAVGATRRTYIFERYQEESGYMPGEIDSFEAMTSALAVRYFTLMRNFFELGGQNIIIPLLSYRAFFERGEEYATTSFPALHYLTQDKSVAFYHSQNADPFFAGITTLLQSPTDSPAYELARAFQDFMANWDYQENRRKIIYEIASIPPLEFWTIFNRMTENERQELNCQIQKAEDAEALQKIVYEHFTRAFWGTMLPMPHFYVGTNIAGDIKFRAPMPLALTGGEYIRGYYTSYPTLFMPLEHLRTIIEDVAFGKRLHAPKTFDYKEVYTADLLETEYQRIQKLIASSESIIGFTRSVEYMDSI